MSHKTPEDKRHILVRGLTSRRGEDLTKLLMNVEISCEEGRSVPLRAKIWFMVDQ